MTRDSQRAACYAWENRHIHPKDTSVIPFEQAQAIVDYVWARFGLSYPPKIRELRRNASGTQANATRVRINIPAAGVSSSVLLHEIAHSMTMDALAEAHRHGPRFVGVYMRLLCELILTFRLEELMAAAKSELVSFNFDGPIH